MRILFVCSGNSVFGVSPIIKTQKESIECSKDGKLYKVTIDYFPITGQGLINYLKHIPKLRNHLKFKNYDIIHAHYGLTGIISVLAKKNQGLVVSFMGDDILGSRRPDGSISSISRIIACINKFFARRFYNFSIVKSREMLIELNITNSSVIPNGVNLDRFKPIDRKDARSKLGIPDNQKLLLFLSRPERAEKNYSLAKKAVQLVNDENVQLLTITNIPPDELVYFYNAADVLLLTSYHEGSPNVIKEAMACNCPIVSTHVGDVEWVIGNTEGCYLASFDPVDFAEKIKLALKFSSLKGKTKGRDRIIELGLDSETIAQRIIGVYHRVIEENT